MGEQTTDTAERLRDLAPAVDVLFHTAEAAMILLSTDGTILRANQLAAELLGYRLADLHGLRSVDITVDADKTDSKERLARDTEGHFVLKTYQRADGTTVPALAMGWPLVDESGEINCMIGVVVPLAKVAASPSLLSAVLEAAGSTAEPERE